VLAHLLTFPWDRSIGTLSSRRAESDDEWNEFSRAFGEVPVPPGQEIKLWIDANARFDLGILSSLPPNVETSAATLRNQVSASSSARTASRGFVRIFEAFKVLRSPVQ
jgi:hypothetical protein